MPPITTSPWHAGERAVQTRRGETELADQLVDMLGTDLSDPARRFVATRPWLPVSTVLDDGTMWASLFTGAPGFLSTDAPNRITIGAAPAAGDPLTGALTDGRRLGSLLLQPERRRRLRANGRVSTTGGELALVTEQVLSNCTRYIQKRSLDPAWTPRPPRVVSDHDELAPHQRRWIEVADTAFLATADLDGAADLSHRGGRPGWISVADGRLAFDEQPGNSMYLTLGNLEHRQAAGMLFVDFERGHTLHVAGRCEVRYVPGAPRVFLVPERVIEIANGAPAPWSPPELSPDL